MTGAASSPGGLDPEVEARIEAMLAERAAELAAEGGDAPVADTPMWLSHHWPDQYDRCAVLGGSHVCRRCLALYPVALVTAVVLGFVARWPEALDAWVLWLFPLAGVVEFVLDNLGVVAYSARRQVALSALGAVAAGLGYVRYLDDGTDRLVWSVVAVYTTVCVAAVAVGALRRRRSVAA